MIRRTEQRTDHIKLRQEILVRLVIRLELWNVFYLFISNGRLAVPIFPIPVSTKLVHPGNEGDFHHSKHPHCAYRIRNISTAFRGRYVCVRQRRNQLRKSEITEK